MRIGFSVFRESDRLYGQNSRFWGDVRFGDHSNGEADQGNRLNRLGLRASGSYGTNDIGYNFLGNDRFCNSSYSAFWSGSAAARRNMKLHNLLHRTYIACKNLFEHEQGQDLVEYALVVALIAFGAVAGMNALAGGINTAFKDVSSSLLKNI